ncbi:MAG TPA: bifunctional adenosylcobinamide kinase/adenosylcobinamide-phosphate guanylyltransferase [Ktedonobacteraceae bacterium]
MTQQPQSELSSGQKNGARLILILGGARSGKSTFAETLAAQSGQSVAFIATATGDDEEMRARIARHQVTRPRTWHTFEEPLDLPGVVRRASTMADVLLLDCLTLWTSNWLLQHTNQTNPETVFPDQLLSEHALKEIDELLAVIRSLSTHQTLIVISNEVGLGVVPAYPLGRAYRDTLGYVNQRLAHAAEHVYLLVAGIPVDLKRLQEEVSWRSFDNSNRPGIY